MTTTAIPGEILTASLLNTMVNERAALTDLANTANGYGADFIANAAKKVASIAALKALRVPQGSDAQTVIVDGVGTYVFSPTNVGADNGGTTIQPSINPDMGRWLKIVEGGSYNVAWFGAKGDGVTDDYPAIYAALNSGAKVVLIPATPNGYYLSQGITVPRQVQLQGDVIFAENYHGAGPQGAKLVFANGVSICVTVSGAVNGNDGGGTPGLRNLVVTRNGTPPAGSIGVQVQGAYNVTMQDVFSYNHAQGFYMLGKGNRTDPTLGGALACNCARLYTAAISDAHFVIDTWPEFRVTGGRSGQNGVNDLAGECHIRITSPTGGSGGAGPNTVVFENYQFNQGGTAGPKYWIEYVNVQNTPGSMRFIGCWVENTTVAGIYTDSTVSQINQFNMVNTTFNAASAATPFLALNPATGINESTILGCKISCSDFTLAPTGTALINRFSVIDTEVTGATSITGAAGQSNNMVVSGCFFNSSIAIGGTWAYIYAQGASSSGFTNNIAQLSSGSYVFVDFPGAAYRADNPPIIAGFGGSAPNLNFRTARGSKGAETISQANDGAGNISAYAHDGTNFYKIGSTRFQVSGTPAQGSTPGTYILSTTPSGSTSPTDRISLNSNNQFYPLTDNVMQLGTSGNRWAAVYAVNGTIQTSDARQKTDVVDSPLGLDFINKLRPVAYRWIEGSKRVVRQVYYDKDGKELPDDATIPEDSVPGEIITESFPGKRKHYGLLAQELKAVVDEFGVDFGGWILTDVNDPDSQQGVRYDQLIAPLIKAVQELTVKVAALEAK